MCGERKENDEDEHKILDVKEQQQNHKCAVVLI